MAASPETAAASLERCRDENKQRNFKSAVGNRRPPYRLARDNAGVFQRPGGGFELFYEMKHLCQVFREAGTPFTYYPSMVHNYGVTTNAAIFISFIGFKVFEGAENEWRDFSVVEIEKRTGLTRKEQINARKLLVEKGMLEEDYQREKHKLFYRLKPDSDDETDPVGTCPKGTCSEPEAHAQRGHGTCPKGTSTNKDQEQEITSAPPGALPLESGKAAEESEHKKFIRYWSEEHIKRFSRKYKVLGGRDGKALKNLLNEPGATAGMLMRFADKCWKAAAADPKRHFYCTKLKNIWQLDLWWNDLNGEIAASTPKPSASGYDNSNSCIAPPPGAFRDMRGENL